MLPAGAVRGVVLSQPAQQQTGPTKIRCLSCCKGGAAVLVELAVDPLVARAERKERAEKHVEKRKRLAASGKVRVDARAGVGVSD
ncbi:hypothetical protein PINS_up022326 [Pythium insidiosum]|nr:hypothetical protein PINS_up022326 [Pythium insidiosum]